MRNIFVVKKCRSSSIKLTFSLFLSRFLQLECHQWRHGAAVWLTVTAAEVPSHERVDANVEMLRLMARDGNRYNGCSDGASAASGGLGGGRKGAGGFSP